MAGRTPKPTALKNLQGTARADRILSNEMNPEPLTTLPQAPEQIVQDEMASQVWYEITSELAALNMIAKVDLQLLSAYCREVSRYWKAQINLDSEGEVITTHTGYPMPNPWLGVSNQALDRALKIAGQFGFTPAARTRIGTPKPTEKDPFDEYLSGSKQGAG